MPSVEQAQGSVLPGTPRTPRHKTVEDISAIIVNQKNQDSSSFSIHIKTIVHALIIAGAACGLAVIKIFRPGLLSTVVASIVTIPIGFAVSYLYKQSEVRKITQSRLLNTEVGVKGLKQILGFLPTWIQITDEDKAEWLNRLLTEMWPYYDKAICDQVIATVEPIMENFRPPGIIKRIGFKQLTFGDAPIRVESVVVDRADDTCVEMEMEVRWSGDASIVFAIEPAAGGDVTRMSPKVTNIAFVGRLRVILKPLVPVIPCFGAIVASLKKPPIVKYDLNFGAALGGSIVAAPIKVWLDDTIRNVVTDMLVWPRRLVIPVVIDESVTGPLELLNQRQVGVLRLKVIRAWDVPKMDTGGKADPIIVMWSDPMRKVETTMKKNTLTPEWNETFFLTIEEPKDQQIRLEMFDVDLINMKEMMKGLNVIANMKNSVGARELIGRQLVPIQQAVKMGKPVNTTIEVGTGDWGAMDGPGKGRGSVELELMYRSLEDLDPLQSDVGMVITTVYRCNDLEGDEKKGMSDPFVQISIKGHKTERTRTITRTRNPEFNQTFKFYDVSLKDEVNYKVFDYDALSLSDELGRYKLPVYEAAEGSYDGVRGLVYGEFPLGDTDAGRIVLKMQFVPFY